MGCGVRRFPPLPAYRVHLARERTLDRPLSGRRTMNPLLTRFFFVIAIALAASAAMKAQAGPLPEADAKEVRNVIVAQLEAFAEDDADRAFQTATPAVREAIGSSGRFLAMVRGAYPMVYRPNTVTFHKPSEDG